MAIAIICPGCKASFRVSDKFAGQTGPCPKCKALIQVPKSSKEEVKVHAPDAGPKDAKGRSVAKPLKRLETEVSNLQIVITVCSVLVALLAAWLLGPKLKNSETSGMILRVVGLLAITPPVALLGYFFLRDREKLEIFSGMDLWVRVAICTAVYIVLWAAFGYVRQQYELPKEVWQLFIILPPMMLFGAMAALGCFELDFGNAFAHYAFYLLIIAALWYVARMHYLFPSMT